MKLISLDNSSPIRPPLWDPRTNRMEETNNRAFKLLDQLMDGPRVDVEAFKRVADICDEEGGISETRWADEQIATLSKMFQHNST